MFLESRSSVSGHKEQLTKHEALLKAKKLLGETIIQTVNQKYKPMTLTEIFTKLQATLAKSKKAVEYLESRNINDVKLEIGYNGTSYKSLKNCIVFPLKDQYGNILNLYGRSINGEGHFYLKDLSGLYPSYLNPETTGTVVLTDLLSVQKYTDYKTLALYGTNGFTQEHETTLRSCKHLQEFILFLDGDKAGNELLWS